jgi:hypothetical protein
MERKHFIQTIMGGSALLGLSSLRWLIDDQPETQQMPVLFVGHGSPMNALEENLYTKQWKEITKQVNKPTAIICISAHWLTNGSFITAVDKPSTIHDFGGFPQALFDVQYPAPGFPELAKETALLFPENTVQTEEEWGLDHGTWSILKHMYPLADVPVLQLSIDYRKPASYHFELAQYLHIWRIDDRARRTRQLGRHHDILCTKIDACLLVFSRNRRFLRSDENTSDGNTSNPELDHFVQTCSITYSTGRNNRNLACFLKCWNQLMEGNVACMSASFAVHRNQRISSQRFYFLRVPDIGYIAKNPNAMLVRLADRFLRRAKRRDDKIDLFLADNLQLFLVQKVRLVDDEVDPKRTFRPVPDLADRISQFVHSSVIQRRNRARNPRFNGRNDHVGIRNQKHWRDDHRIFYPEHFAKRGFLQQFIFHRCKCRKNLCTHSIFLLRVAACQL